MIKKNNYYKKTFFYFSIFLCCGAVAADEWDQGFRVVQRGGRVNPKMQSLLNSLQGANAKYLSQADYRTLLKWRERRQTQNEFLDNALDAAAEQTALLQMASALSARHSRRRHHSFLGDEIRSSEKPSDAGHTDNTAAEEGALVPAHGAVSDRDDEGAAYFNQLPWEVIDCIASLGGADVAGRLGLTCRRFYARYGRFGSLMTRAQRPLPVVEDMSADMQYLWRSIWPHTRTFNLRGGWSTPAQAHDFWVFINAHWGAPVTRLDLSLNRMPYSVITEGLGHLFDGPSQLSELVLDDVRFGTRGLGNFDIEFETLCVQIAGSARLKRLSLRRCNLSHGHLESLMDSLSDCRHLTLDLKGNDIHSLDHPQQHIVDAMALVVEELNLGNNPFDVGSLAPLLHRHNTSLKRLYVRDVGDQAVERHLLFLEALLNSRLIVLDVRDNPGMSGGTFVKSLLRYAPVLDTLATGMTGGQARPGLALFGEATAGTMGPKSRLRTLTFGQDLLDEDVDHFITFSGNKRHLRHIVLEGAISPKSVGRFFEMQLLKEMDLQNPQGFIEEDWRTLADQAWHHRTFSIMDLRAVPEAEYASLAHFLRGLMDSADKALDAHKAQQASAREDIEAIRPQCRHGRQHTNLQRQTKALFVPKRLTVRLPRAVAQAFDWARGDWLTLDFETLKDGY